MDSQEPKVIDLGQKPSGQIHPRELLDFAKGILIVIVVLFVAASGAMLVLGTEDSKTVFEFAKTILPPIATLVIAFYFKSEK